MDDFISATNLTVTKEKNEILHSLNFTVRRGSLTGLIGPSGSGKTTLIRTIVGVQRYDGNMIINGKTAGSSALQHEIGYVTQSPSIYNDLTVEQNLKYFAAIVGAPRSQIRKIINIVDLLPQRKQLVEKLSGGQRARASLAVALLGRPKLLVLDEPTVGLDPILRRKLWNLFKILAKNGTTLIISSHVMDEAELCDDLILMRDGKILWNDSRHKLLKSTGKPDVGSAFIATIERGNA